jgi:hypothetical protein
MIGVATGTENPTRATIQNTLVDLFKNKNIRGGEGVVLLRFFAVDVHLQFKNYKNKK